MINQILHQQLELNNLRHSLYHSSQQGYVRLANFVSAQNVAVMRDFWLNKNIDSNFSSFINNTEVAVGSPNYMYCKPHQDDRAYCSFLWNTPVCEITHQTAFEVQQVRNLIEQRPLYFGLNGIDGQYLQYRVCNTVSPGQVVYPHGDFIEMPRKDPANDHKFDPQRLQATLLLSTPERDYGGDGFVIEDNQGNPQSFAELGFKAGDLIIWRYGNIHQVKNVSIEPPQTGFLRIIYPIFGLSSSQLFNGQSGHFERVGKVAGKEIYQKKVTDEDS